MKIKEVIFALLIGVLVLSSCKKEEDFNPEDNYDIEIINISNVGDETVEFTPFLESNAKVKVKIFDNWNNQTCVYMTGSGYSFSTKVKDEFGEYQKWELGDYIENAYSNYWCYIAYTPLSEVKNVVYYPFKVSLSGKKRYGWVAVSASKIKFVLPKESTQEYDLGIMK